MIDEVRKSNLLVNSYSKYKYTSNELRLIASLIEQVKTKDKDFQIKIVSLKSIGFLKKEYTNHQYLDTLCQSLMSKPFKIPNTKIWVNWFSQIECKNGTIKYCFAPALKEHLLELKKGYTKYHIQNITSLKSSYSIQIFELLKQFEKIGFRKFIIEDFRELLHIPKSYKMNDVKRLIEKSQHELKSKIKFGFKPFYEKQGRKISHINFSIEYHLRPDI